MGSIGKDELDPELVSLRKPRPQIGAVTALGVIVLCIYLGVRLNTDRKFAAQGPSPRTVTIEAILAGEVPVESYVSLTARIEHAPAVRARQSKGDLGLRVAPVVGSAGQLWIAVDGDVWSVPLEDGRYEGRLSRLSDVRFNDPVRAHLRAPHPQFVTGIELRRTRSTSASGATLTTVGGAPVVAGADTEVELEVADPAAATIVARFGDSHLDAAAWTAALVQAGVIAPGTAPARSTTDVALYDVRGPDALATTRRKLEAAGLWAARAEPITVRHKARWRDLVASDSGLSFAGGASLPWPAIDIAAVWAPRPIPADALVLRAGEKPAEYWHVRPIYIALVAFGLLFTWALVRAVRRDLAKPHATHA